MKKILLTIAIVLTAYVSFGQVRGQTVEATQYFKLKTNVMRYFYTITPDDTIPSKSYVDGLLSGIPGGHDPATIGTAGTTAGLSITGQQINMQSATAARNGYMTSSDISTLYSKLTTVSHNNTLTGAGTVADPLKADTAVMAAKLWVLNQNYINENQLAWDSITGKPLIPVISDIAYGATWNGNTDGASKNAIYDKIESLGGISPNHVAVTLTDSATVGGLSLVDDTTQVLNFQRANASQNGFLSSYYFNLFNAKQPALNGTGFVKISGTTISYDNSTYTPTSRTLTINGTTQDLSANRTWNVGTVTSAAMTVPTGLSISGSPITTSGTFALSYASGYSIPTTTKQGQWDAAYNDKVNSLAVTGTTTKTITLTQQDGGTVTGSFTDMTASAVNSYKLLAGVVTGRNINVTLANYTPANYDMISVLADTDIATGDTITLSVNGGTQYNVFETLSYHDSLAITVVFRDNVWYLLGSVGEEHVSTGVNTGNQSISLDSTATKYLIGLTGSDTIGIVKGITDTVTVLATKYDLIQITETDPIFAADSAKLIHWTDTIPSTVGIATKYDLTLLGGDTLFTTIAISDETTALTVGTAKRTFRMPVGCTLTKVRANVVTAPTGANLIFDIKESGTTVLSTLLSIDATEKTSKTAASAAVISDSSIADDAEMTIDITQVGSTIAGAGAKIVLYYVKN